MLDDVKRDLLDQWQVIVGAPAIFIMALIVASILVWLAMRWAYETSTKHRQTLIALKDAQLADYQQKLGGASPDEAKARIEKLESQVAALLPRELSLAQIDKIATTAAAPKPNSTIISIIFDVACRDGQSYAAQFVRAFGIAGWRVAEGQMMAPAHKPRSGLGISVADSRNPTPAQQTVMRAFLAAGLEFDLSPQAPGTASDVTLLIAAKQP